MTMNLFGLVAYAAENAGNAGEGGSTFAAMVSSFLPLILLVVLFYFMLIRPQKKREKENKLRNRKTWQRMISCQVFYYFTSNIKVSPSTKAIS